MPVVPFGTTGICISGGYASYFFADRLAGE